MAKRKSITSRSKPRGYSSLAAQQICHLDDMMQDGLGMLHGLMGQANRRLKVRDETDTVMPLAVQQQINALGPARKGQPSYFTKVLAIFQTIANAQAALPSNAIPDALLVHLSRAYAQFVYQEEFYLQPVLPTILTNGNTTLRLWRSHKDVPADSRSTGVKLFWVLVQRSAGNLAQYGIDRSQMFKDAKGWWICVGPVRNIQHTCIEEKINMVVSVNERVDHQPDIEVTWMTANDDMVKGAQCFGWFGDTLYGVNNIDCPCGLESHRNQIYPPGPFHRPETSHQPAPSHQPTPPQGNARQSEYLPPSTHNFPPTPMSSATASPSGNGTEYGQRNRPILVDDDESDIKPVIRHVMRMSSVKRPRNTATQQPCDTATLDLIKAQGKIIAELKEEMERLKNHQAQAEKLNHLKAVLQDVQAQLHQMSA